MRQAPPKAAQAQFELEGNPVWYREVLSQQSYVSLGVRPCPMVAKTWAGMPRPLAPASLVKMA